MSERLQSAADSLQRGDPQAARSTLETAGETDSAVYWILLARACRDMGDHAAEDAALDALLAREPRNLPAMIMKGDCLLRSGDERGSTSFYQLALAVARRERAVPPPLAAELKRIEGLVARAGDNYRAHLEARLAAAGLTPASVSPRFAEAIDILFGERETTLSLQRPSVFYFPHLPQIQFYARENFAWLSQFEAEAGAIRDELLAVLAAKASFKPYVEPERNRPHHDFHGLLNNPDWSAFYLIEDGAPHPANAARCPRTMAALEEVPLCDMPGRTPSVLFSLLQPGTRIPPHCGMINTRLICHLPLIVPPRCALRVGSETRPWEETLIFDDTIEHEAWNDSDRPRVVLLFDIWRPELDVRERQAVAAMFAAIDSYGVPEPAG